ncbi:MAG: hypothetical protein Q4E07_02680 [Eubacteriales bacterium]|nr:hypothetical protein [Eubacteriales bacterium]
MKTKITALLLALTIIGTGFVFTANAEAIELQALYDEEAAAFNFYQSVIAQFGNIRPYANILNAEKNHIEAVKTLAQNEKFELNLNTENKALSFNSLEDARQAAIALEQEDIALIKSLLEDESLDDYSKNILSNLLRASENHLRALEQNASSLQGQNPNANKGRNQRQMINNGRQGRNGNAQRPSKGFSQGRNNNNGLGQGRNNGNGLWNNTQPRNNRQGFGQGFCNGSGINCRRGN